MMSDPDVATRSNLPVTKLRLSSDVTLRRIVRIICKSNRTAAVTKNGILILVMNGCTTTDVFVIISCQYSTNNMYEEIVNGKKSSVRAANVRSV